MGVVLNDVAVSLVLHLEEEVNRTKANSKKSAKKGPQWLSLRSPFDDEVGSRPMHATPTHPCSIYSTYHPLTHT